MAPLRRKILETALDEQLVERVDLQCPGPAQCGRESQRCKALSIHFDQAETAPLSILANGSRRGLDKLEGAILPVEAESTSLSPSSNALPSCKVHNAEGKLQPSRRVRG